MSLGRIRLSVTADHIGPAFSASDGIMGVKNGGINGETELGCKSLRICNYGAESEEKPAGTDDMSCPASPLSSSAYRTADTHEGA